MKKIGVYVHIPFCMAKCYYCDFNSYAGKGDVGKDTYLTFLEKESIIYNIKYLKMEAISLYIGGGTPTCLTDKQLMKLFNILSSNLKFANDIEITIEGNPGTLDMKKLAISKGFGCNRLSLGVQSFSARDLQILGRIHTVQDVYNTFKMARGLGFNNINLDLMYGLPGQDIQGWKENLKKIVELQPEHISLYQLNIEKNTAFFKLYKRGLLEEFEQDVAFLMYDEAINYLSANGYRHYEISNFAKKGRESYHNKIYWRNEEYLGLGAGAASYLDSNRYTNMSSLDDYQCALDGGELPIKKTEVINKKLSMAETMFLGLRLLEGVKKSDFIKKHGISVEIQYKNAIGKLKEQGLLCETPTHISLSKKGLYVANVVFCEFL